MIAVYILKSDQGKHYIGSTVDLDVRLRRHALRTAAKTTQQGVWKLCYYHQCDSIEDARALEKKVKSFKGGNSFKKIINGEVAEWPKAPHC
ncbi:MAG: GIY-YIG nuclease family protein [Patescibacteria group bacterium]|nr:GIY-YIG nuclease family protein [Patescibacteria group bacterium]